MTITQKSTCLFLILFLYSIGILANNPANVWRPITQAELAMEKPQVEADADAEAIFWEVRLDDKKRKKLSFEHYVRVKIFTERGRERFAKIDIPFYKGKKVENVAARVIKPDGSIVELQPQDIFEREIVRQRKTKYLAKSFAVPGIAPGVIVEYQYSESIKGDSLNGERLYFQRDIPLQKISYFIRPFKSQSLNFNPKNMRMESFKKLENGFYVGTRTNVPAYKEEPRMPPEDETRQWINLNYSYSGFGNSWSRLVSRYGAYYSKVTKPDKIITNKAKELTANASTKKEKLEALYEFAQKRIKNKTYNSSLNVGKRKKLKKASQILISGFGTAGEIDFLFASLARALDFETNLAFLSNRNRSFFNPNHDSVNPNSIAPGGIAIKLDGKWNYFNPGTPFLPFGKLVWYEESVYTMLVSEGWNFWTRTPLSTHEKSKGIRKSKFTLSEDGTLEGNVSVEYTGNWAISQRSGGLNETNEKRESDFAENLKEWVSTGEFSDISANNFETSDKPVGYSYKLRIPNYATKTGKRLFFQPAVFQFNSKPEFSSSTRIYPIYFHYPWSEADEIEIKLPDGYEVENIKLPQHVKEGSNLGGTTYSVSFDKETNTLKYTRDFYFGEGGRILFPATAYAPLKKLFDLFHNSDTHTFSLKRK